jgi:Ni2+-binding GTPase involved in maturation of urease and hydrogenase
MNCPGLFDLGKRATVIILSVTEGDDKPLKYPHMSCAAEIMIVNKIDRKAAMQALAQASAARRTSLARRVGARSPQNFAMSHPLARTSAIIVRLPMLRVRGYAKIVHISIE